MQRTLALIKPDAFGQPWYESYQVRNEEYDEEDPASQPWLTERQLRAADKATVILDRIKAEGFTIAQSRALKLTVKQARQFYAEHAGKSFYDQLVSFMSSGPLMALELHRENAIAHWRATMGATNATRAREQAVQAHPLDDSRWPLRALVGTDGTHNATHGSDAVWTATRELEFFFPAPATWQRSALLVTPAAMNNGAGPKVAQAAQAGGLWVLGYSDIAAASLPASARAAFSGGDDDLEVAMDKGGEARLVVVEGYNAVVKAQLLAGPVSQANAQDVAESSMNAVLAPSEQTPAVLAALDGSAVADAVAAAWPKGMPVEYTLAMIKPGVADRSWRAIMAAVKERGFQILASKRVHLPQSQAEEFYAEHRGKHFFARLTEYMSSEPMVAMVLSKPAAIVCWRAMCGPTATATAQRDAPESLRAQYGTDGTRNAVHGSDSAESAAREIAFHFPTFRQARSGAAGDVAAWAANTQVGQRWMLGRGVVPTSLHSTLVRACVELCKVKPAGTEAVTWLGKWLLAHNPRTGVPGHEQQAFSVQDGAVGPAEDHTQYVPAEAGSGPLVEELAPAEGAPEAAQAAPSTQAAQDEADDAAWRKSLTVVFALGAPGSGKGTQCARVAERFGYAHVSTGDLLRAEVAQGTALGKEVSTLMEAGQLVPTATVLRVLKKAMKAHESRAFLVDGFPRAEDQAYEFEAAICQPRAVLEFTASDEELTRRLLARGEASGRSDDKEAAIVQRLATFKSASEPVIDFYRKLGVVRTINSDGCTPDEVFERAALAVGPQLVAVAGPPGCGKSTLAVALAAQLGWTALSTGDLLRTVAESDSALGQEVAAAQRSGELVTNDLVLRVLQAEFRKAPMDSYILDGFPRTMEQAGQLEAQVAPISHIIQLNLPERDAKRRIAGRAASAGVAARAADKDAAALERQFRVYSHATANVLSTFAAAGLVTQLSAKAPVDQIVAQAAAAVRPQMVFVLGGPGSGKGTQCARLVQSFGFTHLSAGDLLRAEVARGSPEGSLIQSCMESGRLVPLSVTLGLLANAMKLARAARYLIDGFPRALDQVVAFEAELGMPDSVLFFDAPTPVLRARLLERGKTSGRSDDNDGAIGQRIATFKETSMPVIHHYARAGRVHKFDASGTIDEVAANVAQLFTPRYVCVIGAPGSGKTTQCQRLARDRGFEHVCMDSVYDAAIARNADGSARVAACRASGKPVPADISVALLRKAVQGSQRSKFVIDGFPHTAEEAAAFDAAFGAPEFVLQLHVPDRVAMKRLAAAHKANGTDAGNDSALIAAWHKNGQPVADAFHAAGALRRVAGVADKDSVAVDVAAHFRTELVVLIGAAGSGRGEFKQRAASELGYASLHVPSLLCAEARDPTSAAGEDIRAAMAAHRTVPLEAGLTVIKKAIAASSARRFILDGYPRVVSLGYPAIHDQVYALEREVGPVRGAVLLLATRQQRVQRAGVSDARGDQEALAASMDALQREKMGAAHFFRKLNKLYEVNTQGDADAVFDEARPFIE